MLAIPSLASAADSYPPLICTGLFGCGQGPDDVIMNSAIPVVGTLLVQIAAGGAVLAVVYGGIKMALSGGDEGKVSSARKGIMYALGGLALVVTATSLVSFVTTENYGQADPDLLFGSGGLLSSALRIALILFNAGFVVIVIIAGINMVIAAGSPDKFKNAANMIKWAVIGAIIVNIARAGIQAFLALQL
jgi:hypothetical protein